MTDGAAGWEPTTRERVTALLDEAVRALGGDGGCVYWLDAGAPVLRQVLSLNIPPELSRVPIPVGHGVAGTAVARAATQRIEHYPTHPLAREPFLSDGLQTVMAAPLVIGDAVRGAVSVVSHRDAHRFGAGDAARLEGIAARIAAALEGGGPA